MRVRGERGRTRSWRRALGGAVAAVLVVAACSGDDAPVPPPSTTVPLPTTVPRSSDGVLTLGVLLPETGPGSAFGPALVEAVRRAVRVVNENGGVLGRDVRVVVEDEGPDVASATAALDRLLQQGQIDAIVGPASSRVALGVLNQTVASGVLTCSPAATAISLSQFPDQGLFIRTVPSDALQAEAMARLIDQTGLGEVAITYPDDAYGQRFAEALRSSLGGLAVTVTADVPFDPLAEDHTATVTDVLAGSPSVVAVVGDNDVGVRVLTHLLGEAVGLLPLFVVSDALRRPAQPALLTGLSASQLGRIRGVSPEVLPQSSTMLELLGLESGDPAGAFAVPAFDCVNLIALAAIQAGSDDPSAIASQLSSVSRGGTSCRTFPTCVSLMAEQRNIDYDGYGGLLRLDANGDLTIGRFERFDFDDEGRDVTVQRFEVGVDG